MFTIVLLCPGFDVAPGDASDVAVCNQHTWGSHMLAFADGALAATAYTLMRFPEQRGVNSSSLVDLKSI